MVKLISQAEVKVPENTQKDEHRENNIAKVCELFSAAVLQKRSYKNVYCLAHIYYSERWNTPYPSETTVSSSRVSFRPLCVMKKCYRESIARSEVLLK